jgi:hypothetical protein
LDSLFLFQSLIVGVGLGVIILIVFKWYNEFQSANKKDYEKAKSPFYVYYLASGTKLPFSLFLLIQCLISITLGILAVNLLNNLMAGLIISFTFFLYLRHSIIVKCIKRSERIDKQLPLFLIHFFDIYQNNNDPLYVLKESLVVADSSFKNVLRKMHLNITNKSDPKYEVSKAMKEFKNPLLRDFLEYFLDELVVGSGFEKNLSRLIERAEARKRFAADRKVETFLPRMFTYISSVIFIFCFLGKLAFNYDDYLLFTQTMYGKIAVSVMLLILMFMNMSVQALSNLKEG